MTFAGVHTALITTFTPDGGLDIQQYEVLCQRQIDAGIHGLVPCGTTGEAPTLTNEEWAECIRTAVRVSAGRVPVTAGVGTNNTASTLARLEQAKRWEPTAYWYSLLQQAQPTWTQGACTQAAAVGLPL